MNESAITSAALASMRVVQRLPSRVMKNSTTPTMASAATMPQTTGEISANLENMDQNPFRNVSQFAGQPSDGEHSAHSRITKKPQPVEELRLEMDQESSLPYGRIIYNRFKGTGRLAISAYRAPSGH